MKELLNKNHFKNIEFRKEFFCFLIILFLILLCILQGIKRIYTSDFSPINGDFQNYNPYRRLLDGQIPFKDFSVYLGLGHLYLGSFLLRFLPNNFTMSLFSTTFITVLGFEISVFIIAYLIFKDKLLSLVVTLFSTIFNILRPNFITNNISQNFIPSFDFGLEPGLSARMIRALVVPVLILLVLVGFKVIDKLSLNTLAMKNNISTIKKIYLGFCAGIMILWSNDYGMSSYICCSFTYFFVIIKLYNKNVLEIIKSVLIYILSSLVGIILVLFVVTHGNIDSWIVYTLGAGKYQSWYYNPSIIGRSFFVYDIDSSYLTIISFMIAIYYIFKLFRIDLKGRGIFKEIFCTSSIIFILLSGCIASNIYKLISDGGNREFLYLALFFIVLCNVINILRKLLNKYNLILGANIALFSSLVITISYLISEGSNEFKKFFVNERTGQYIKELGGYITNLYPSIDFAVQKIGDNKIFSTYSSAIESITNQYQPSGTDYIIHVLGDKQRENYLIKFRE